MLSKDAFTRFACTAFTYIAKGTWTHITVSLAGDKGLLVLAFRHDILSVGMAGGSHLHSSIRQTCPLNLYTTSFPLCCANTALKKPVDG